MTWLVDTNVFVDVLRGHAPALAWFRGPARERAVACSVITVAELRSGFRPGEEDRLGVLLQGVRRMPADDAVALRAGDYLRAHGKSHGLDLADALIAATAASVGATLVTRNLKHFPMKDLTARAPY